VYFYYRTYNKVEGKTKVRVYKYKDEHLSVAITDKVECVTIETKNGTFEITTNGTLSTRYTITYKPFGQNKYYIIGTLDIEPTIKTVTKRFYLETYNHIKNSETLTDFFKMLKKLDWTITSFYRSLKGYNTIKPNNNKTIIEVVSGYLN